MENAQDNQTTPDIAAVDIHRRLQRTMIILIGLGALTGWGLAGARMGLSILLGGALSVFNERWLNVSTKSIIEFASSTGNPSVPTAAKFIFRFVVMGLVIVGALKTGYFHLLGIGIGLLAFVGAAMIEAIYQAVSFKSDR